MKRLYFCGIGGAGVGPLALIAHKAGYEVLGCDKQESGYTAYLRERGLQHITITDSADDLKEQHHKKPVDWVIYSSALEKEHANHPIFAYARGAGLKATKRDVFLHQFITENQLKLLAVSGTHGKTTTTAMLIWLLQQAGIPASHSVGAKLPFADMGHFDPRADYFVYECDEYDKNFLAFSPYINIISGIDYDHPDIYPTREDYYAAFRTFISQSQTNILWETDAVKLGIKGQQNCIVLDELPLGLRSITLTGEVNRRNARLCVQAASELSDDSDLTDLISYINRFPGLSRRFEMLAPNIYTDYAHTPEKIRGAIQIAQETAKKGIVVVYEGLHNTRQHFIKDELPHLFDAVDHLYIVPSYRAREDESLEDLTPQKLAALTAHPEKVTPSELDNELLTRITAHAKKGDTVLCLSAGGGGSLDEWLRKQLLTA